MDKMENLQKTTKIKVELNGEGGYFDCTYIKEGKTHFVQIQYPICPDSVNLFDNEEQDKESEYQKEIYSECEKEIETEIGGPVLAALSALFNKYIDKYTEVEGVHVCFDRSNNEYFAIGSVYADYYRVSNLFSVLDRDDSEYDFSDLLDKACEKLGIEN